MRITRRGAREAQPGADEEARASGSGLYFQGGANRSECGDICAVLTNITLAYAVNLC